MVGFVLVVTCITHSVTVFHLRSSWNTGMLILMNMLALRSWITKGKCRSFRSSRIRMNFEKKQLLGATSQPAPICDIYKSPTNSKQTRFYFPARLNWLSYAN